MSNKTAFNTLFWGTIVAWLVGVLFTAGITLGALYVAWHFIAKFW